MGRDLGRRRGRSERRPAEPVSRRSGDAASWSAPKDAPADVAGAARLLDRRRPPRLGDPARPGWRRQPGPDRGLERGRRRLHRDRARRGRRHRPLTRRHRPARRGRADRGASSYRCPPIVRPRWLVVGSVLTAALALVALPGLAGSRAPSAVEPVPAGAFQPLSVPASGTSSALSIAGLDAGYISAGFVDCAGDLHRAGRARPNPGPTGRARGRPARARLARRAASRRSTRCAARPRSTTTARPRCACRAGRSIVVCGARRLPRAGRQRLRPAAAVPDHRPLPAGLLRHLRLPVVERRRRRHGVRLLNGPGRRRYPSH